MPALKPFLLTIFALSAVPLAARPLITSSEETHARLCLHGQDEPDRLIRACDIALSGGSLTTRQRVELLVARADALRWDGDYDAARAGYETIIADTPGAIHAWNGLGWTLHALGDPEAAYGAFTTSLDLSISVGGLGGKAAAGRAIGVLTGEEARQFLKAALAIDPDSIWTHRELGWNWYDDGDPVAAASAFEDALDLDPEDPDTLFGLGRAALLANNLEAALAHFNKAVEIDPEHGNSLIARLETFRSLDRNAMALREASRVIEIMPEDSRAHVEKARALMGLERRVAAIEALDAAETRLGPSNYLLYWRADLLLGDGDHDAARETIDRALTLDGANYWDHLLKCWITLGQGDYLALRDAAEAVLAVEKDNPTAHLFLAIVLVEEGRPGHGMVSFRRAVNAGLPDSAYQEFVRALIRNGRFIEALRVRLND